jgi:hypothetical protein
VGSSKTIRARKSDCFAVRAHYSVMRLRNSVSPAWAERLIKTENHEFSVVRLSGADMASNAEGEVVIIDNADVMLIEKENIFDCDEGKCEVDADSDITWLSGKGKAVRVANIQEIDRESLLHWLIIAHEIDLADRLESIPISLRIVALDDETAR